MKRTIATLLLVIMVFSVFSTVFAAEACGRGNCKGKLIYSYGPWEGPTPKFRMDSELGSPSFGLYAYNVYTRTVTVKCTQNSNHNFTFRQERWDYLGPAW